MEASDVVTATVGMMDGSRSPWAPEGRSWASFSSASSSTWSILTAFAKLVANISSVSLIAALCRSVFAGVSAGKSSSPNSSGYGMEKEMSTKGDRGDATFLSSSCAGISSSWSDRGGAAGIGSNASGMDGVVTASAGVVAVAATTGLAVCPGDGIGTRSSR